MSTKQLFANLSVARQQHRAERAHRRELEHALAVYTSATEIEDVLSSLTGQDSADADLVRDILTTNLAMAHGRGRTYLGTPFAA